MNSEQDALRLTKDTFLKSRSGAILRCAEIMVDSGRKDLAKQILTTTHINKEKLAEIRARNTPN